MIAKSDCNTDTLRYLHQICDSVVQLGPSPECANLGVNGEIQAAARPCRSCTGRSTVSEDRKLQIRVQKPDLDAAIENITG